MAGEVRSAGTVVAAILENMGMLTQGQILNDFSKFFQTGGALVYLIVCIGAIISFVVFGSVRMGVYLLIGPGLFSFLLRTTAEVPKVQYKLGASQATPVDVNFIGPLEVHKPGETIKVSWFFAWYTNIIDQFVNSSVHLILENEDDHKLLFIMRDHVLNILRRSAPTDEGLMSVIVEDLYGSCSNYMNVMNAFATEKYTDFNLRTLEMQVSRGDADAQNKLDQINAELEELRKFEESEGKVAVSFSPALKNLIGQSPDKYYSTLGMSDETRANKDLFIQRDIPALSATCKQVWSSTHDLILIHAKSTLKGIMSGLNSNIPITTENERKICLEISSKLYKRYAVAHPDNVSLMGTECDLTQTVALFMLRNVIGTSSALRRNVRITRDRMRLVQGRKDLMWVSGTSDTLADNAERLIQREDVGELKTHWDDQEKRLLGWDTKSQQWRTFEQAHFFGQEEAAYGGQQQSRVTEMTQKVFSYGMHIPYWQGVMLYLLAIAFPFSTVLVLMPNRVSTFFTMPLFWLWVKSWDIGFAVVMIFDRVMWNLLPSSDAPYNAFSFVTSAASSGTQDPGALVRAALSVDPIYHVNMRYQLLAIALTSVPVVTGSVILKGKRMVLASFVDAPLEKATHSSHLARQQDLQGRLEAMQYDMYCIPQSVGAAQALPSAGSRISPPPPESSDSSSGAAPQSSSGASSQSSPGQSPGRSSGASARSSNRQSSGSTNPGSTKRGTRGILTSSPERTQMARDLAFRMGRATLGVSALKGYNGKFSAGKFSKALEDVNRTGQADSLTKFFIDFTGSLGNAVSADNISDAVATTLETYADLMEQVKFRDISEAYVVDPTFGRLGDMTIQMEAGAQGMTDGAGNILYAANVYVENDKSFTALRKKEIATRKAILMKEIELGAEAGKSALDMLQRASGGKQGWFGQTMSWVGNNLQGVSRIFSTAAPAALGYYFNRYGAPGEKSFGREDVDRVLAIATRNAGPSKGYAATPYSVPWESPFFIQSGQYGEPFNSNELGIESEDLALREQLEWQRHGGSEHAPYRVTRFMGVFYDKLYTNPGKRVFRPKIHNRKP